MVVTALTTIGLAYAGICTLAFVFQNRLVWHPGPAHTVDPTPFGLEDARLNTRDGVALHAWYVPGTSGSVVLVAHGNGGTMVDALPLAQAFSDMGHAVLLYDYRGYGNSEGRPSEHGTYLDAEAAYDWLIAEKGFSPRNIVAYGNSLGGAVSIELASRRQTAAVVVENTFSTLADIGAETFPWLPVRLLSRIRYDSIARAAEIQVPVLVLHSPGDEMIPIDQGRRLYEAFSGQKRFLETSGRHNDGGFTQSRGSSLIVANFIGGSVD